MTQETAPALVTLGLIAIGIIIVWMLLGVLKIMLSDRPHMRLWGIWLLIIGAISLCGLATLPVASIAEILTR